MKENDKKRIWNNTLLGYIDIDFSPILDLITRSLKKIIEDEGNLYVFSDENGKLDVEYMSIECAFGDEVRDETGKVIKDYYGVSKKLDDLLVKAVDDGCVDRDLMIIFLESTASKIKSLEM